MQKIIETSCYFINDVSCYEVAKDFANPIIAALAVIISIFVAFRQLSKQHNNTLLVQREDTKKATKIELFKEINLLLDSVTSIVLEVNIFCIIKQHPYPGTPIELNQDDYKQLSSKINNGLITVISKIESHEIINQKLFKVFRYSLQSIIHDIRKLEFNKDRKFVLDSMENLSSDASCYLSDFQICMQNLAYGDIFESKLPSRIPANKELKVITADEKELDKLLYYFSHETTWGKNCNKHMKEAIEKFSS